MQATYIYICEIRVVILLLPILYVYNHDRSIIGTYIIIYLATSVPNCLFGHPSGRECHSSFYSTVIGRKKSDLSVVLYYYYLYRSRLMRLTVIALNCLFVCLYLQIIIVIIVYCISYITDFTHYV